MSHRSCNPLRIAALSAIVLVALLVPTSGAFAATLASDGNTVTFTAATGAGAQTLRLDEVNTDELTIRTSDDPVDYDDDGDSTSVIDDSGADCVDAAGDNVSPATEVVCADIDRIVANTNTGDDCVDATPFFWCGLANTNGLLNILATVNGGIDEDGIHGGLADASGDTLNGDAGDDFITGEDGDDAINGGSGDDELDGNDDDDVLRGGADDDDLDPSNGADDSRGEAGNDRVFEDDDGDEDLALGGTGADTLDYNPCGNGCSDNDDLHINENGVEDDGDTEDDPDNRFDEFETIDFFDQTNFDATATVLSTSGNDSILGDGETDVFTPRDGADVLNMRDNDDTANTVDGFPDVVNCGNGDDTANADQFDELNGCEDENITNVESAFDDPDNPDTPEDDPPSVAFSNLDPNQFLPPIGFDLEATASDDIGVVVVVFFDDTQRLCDDSTAPYTCDWNHTSNDVGDNTMTVFAVDTAGQLASDVQNAIVGKFNPDDLETDATNRDLNGPRRTRVHGMLDLPSGVFSEEGCEGNVRVRIFDGTDRIRQQLVSVQEDCDYAKKFRLPGAQKLDSERVNIKFKFKGNSVLDPEKGDPEKTKVQNLP